MLSGYIFLQIHIHWFEILNWFYIISLVIRRGQSLQVRCCYRRPLDELFFLFCLFIIISASFLWSRSHFLEFSCSKEGFVNAQKLVGFQYDLLFHPLRHSDLYVIFQQNFSGHLLRLTYRIIDPLNSFARYHLRFGASFYHICIYRTRTYRINLVHQQPRLMFQFPIARMALIMHRRVAYDAFMSSTTSLLFSVIVTLELIAGLLALPLDDQGGYIVQLNSIVVSLFVWHLNPSKSL